MTTTTYTAADAVEILSESGNGQFDFEVWTGGEFPRYHGTVWFASKTGKWSVNLQGVEFCDSTTYEYETPAEAVACAVDEGAEFFV